MAAISSRIACASTAPSPLSNGAGRNSIRVAELISGSAYRRTVDLIATKDQSPESDPAVRERLLTAWRGEILAGAVYELIARRLDDREADILRRMAQAESGHRRRIEARMTELGIPIPDRATVKVPLWLRLQARIAPVDRLLAAREAAEDEEVDDLYKRSTGDNTTDRLLRDIRREERSHSMAVADLRAGGGDASAGGDGFGVGQPGDPLSAEPPRPSPARSRRRRSHCRPGRPPTAGQDPRTREVAPLRCGLDLRRDLWRQRRPGRRVRDRRRRVGRDRRQQRRADRRPGGRDRVGAVDGDRRVPGRALRERGRRRQHRARASGDRRAPRGGEGGAVALLPAQGHRPRHRRRSWPSS